MTLNETRQTILTALTSGEEPVVDETAGYGFMPGRLSGTAIIVLPSQPYLSTSDSTPFGSFDVNHTVSPAVRAGDNETITKQLDELIENTVVALVNAGVSVSETSTPYPLDMNGAQFIAVDISVIQTVKL
jgi:hypothetical protein